VALAARQTGRLQDVTDRIEPDCSTAVIVPTDVSYPVGYDGRDREAGGGVDLLVINAGVMRSAPVARSDLKDLRQMLDVDLFGLSSSIRRLWSLQTWP
jgi:NADP-dependent 3-hydroxy acid dehydrogenase YdfG